MLFVLTLSLLEVNTNVKTANAYNNETSNVELGNWSFTQAGQYNPVQAGNEGYIRSVTVGNDVLSNWERDVNQKQVQSASTGSNEFKIEIANTGWEVQWKQKPLRIQPDAVMASTIVDAKINHKYVVSFTAKASSKKYAYVRFGTEKEGVLPYDSHGIVCADNATKQVIEIGTTEQKYTFIFSNAVEVKDFTITDNGSDYDIETKPIETTKAPTPPNNNSTPNITPVNRVKYIRPKKRNDLFKSR